MEQPFGGPAIRPPAAAFLGRVGGVIQWEGDPPPWPPPSLWPRPHCAGEGRHVVLPLEPALDGPSRRLWAVMGGRRPSSRCTTGSRVVRGVVLRKQCTAQ